MRGALSGTSSRCFTVSPALISIFGVVVGWCWLCFLFGVLVLCCLVFFVVSCFPHE